MYGITGATGKLGTLVIDNLLQKVYPSEIVAIVRNVDKANKLKEKGIQVRYGDYNEYQSLKSALKGVHSLLLISGTEIGKRIVQHQNVVNAAKENGVKKVIYTSIPMKFPPGSPLVKDHMETEEYIKKSGLDYVIMRNTFYAEVLLDNLPLILNKGVYITASGDGGVSYVTRNDLAKTASELLITNKFNNKTFDLTGPEVVNSKMFVEKINANLNTDVKLNNLNENEMIQLLKKQGLPDPAIFGRLGFEKMIGSKAMEFVSDNIKLITGEEPKPLDSLLKNTNKSD